MGSVGFLGLQIGVPLAGGRMTGLRLVLRLVRPAVALLVGNFFWGRKLDDFAAVVVAARW
jgi:hypothetical protein